MAMLSRTLALFKGHRVRLDQLGQLVRLDLEAVQGLQVLRVFRVTKEILVQQVLREQQDRLDLRVSKDLLDH
jgi:hypothetical protein